MIWLRASSASQNQNLNETNRQTKILQKMSMFTHHWCALDLCFDCERRLERDRLIDLDLFRNLGRWWFLMCDRYSLLLTRSLNLRVSNSICISFFWSVKFLISDRNSFNSLSFEFFNRSHCFNALILLNLVWRNLLWVKTAYSHTQRYLYNIQITLIMPNFTTIQWGTHKHQFWLI